MGLLHTPLSLTSRRVLRPLHPLPELVCCEATVLSLLMEQGSVDLVMRVLRGRYWRGAIVSVVYEL